MVWKWTVYLTNCVYLWTIFMNNDHLLRLKITIRIPLSVCSAIVFSVKFYIWPFITLGIEWNYWIKLFEYIYYVWKIKEYVWKLLFQIIKNINDSCVIVGLFLFFLKALSYLNIWIREITLTWCWYNELFLCVSIDS